MSLKALQRHLQQAHYMSYISSHLEVSNKKVFLKISQNSQENNCAEVAFTCDFDKNEALAQAVSCEFCETGFMSKYKRQMFANVL